jgi:hypothetical protein
MRRAALFSLMGLAIGYTVAIGWTPAANAAYDPKGKRDPFVPLVTEHGQRFYPPGTDEEEASGVLKVILQGIVFEPKGESYAVINGKILREREEIEGMKVLRIESDSVTLLVEGQPHRLTLYQATEENSSP